MIPIKGRGFINQGSGLIGITAGLPKDRDNRVLGPKCYNLNSIWALKPSYLDPWTLRDCFCV